MEDGYDYFGDKHQSLEISAGKDPKKWLTDKNYSISSAPIQYIPRDRMYKRQSFLQDQRVEGQNRSIILNDGNVDRMIIGYSKDSF